MDVTYPTSVLVLGSRNKSLGCHPFGTRNKSTLVAYLPEKG